MAATTPNGQTIDPTGPRIAALDIARGVLVAMAGIVLGDSILAAAGIAIDIPAARVCAIAAAPAFMLIAGLVSGRCAPMQDARWPRRRAYPYVDRLALAAICAVAAALLAPAHRIALPVLTAGLAFVAIPALERLAFRLEAGGVARFARIIVLVQVAALVSGPAFGWMTAAALFLLGRLMSRYWGSLAAAAQRVGPQAGFLSVAVVAVALLLTIAKIPGESRALSDTILSRAAIAYAIGLGTLALAFAIEESPAARFFSVLGRGAFALAIVWPLLAVLAGRLVAPRMMQAPVGALLVLGTGFATAVAVAFAAGLFRTRGRTTRADIASDSARIGAQAR
jgi:hypothetical protein